LDLISAGDQHAISEARNQAAREASRQISAGVQQFVADCVATLRQETAKLCDEMLVSFRDGKTGVHQKTLNRLVNFIDQFKSLNFAGDREMEARLDQTRKTLLTRTAEEYRDDDKARTKLTQGIQNLANVARDMAHADATEIVERFGQMGRRRFNLAA